MSYAAVSLSANPQAVNRDKMIKLTLDLAAKIIDAAFAQGREIGCNPLSIAVLDAGGHMVAFMRQDESGILRPEIATGKAYGALGFGLGSREIGQKNPLFLAAVAAASTNAVA